MKKMTGRISVAGTTYKDCLDSFKIEAAAFLEISVEELEKIYDSLEVSGHCEKVSPELRDYFGDFNFTIPTS